MDEFEKAERRRRNRALALLIVGTLAACLFVLALVRGGSPFALVATGAATAGTLLLDLLENAKAVFRFFRRVHAARLALELAAGATVVAGVVGLFFEFQERDRARIVAAWQIVAAQPAAVVGESAALELLVRQGERLDGLHLRLPDLTGADLRGALLSRARIISTWDADTETGRRANLKRAKLAGATLYRANLFPADLSGADLSRARLRTAKNLNQDRIDEAFYRRSTGPPFLPDGFRLPPARD